ncbi:hypothetical protein Tco_0013942 [Tanacetum coccineum]
MAKRIRKPLLARDDGEIYSARIWIPSQLGGIRKLIMDEAHTSIYSVHPEFVQEKTEKIVKFKESIKAARSRRKKYVIKRRKPLEFQVGDRVLLKVSPWKGVVHDMWDHLKSWSCVERLGLSTEVTRS